MGFGKYLFYRYVRGSRVLVPMRYVLEPIDIAPVQIRNFYPYPPPPVSSKNNHNNFGGKTLLWRPPDIRKLRKCFDGAWTTSSLSYYDFRYKNENKNNQIRG